MKKLIALIAVAGIVLLPTTLAGDDTAKKAGGCPAQGASCCKEKQSCGPCPVTGKSAKTTKKEVKAAKKEVKAENAAKKAAKKQSADNK
ncbi:MAG TPA: hypothetical protein PKM73_14745 [Verrucomicrobiota bacterium]|nr:hypothetical protein [Verrucomicrobiota bacterium]HNU52660.1 hypothetical protein [Verrucomicrobiota bacterium]